MRIRGDVRPQEMDQELRRLRADIRRYLSAMVESRHAMTRQRAPSAKIRLPLEHRNLLATISSASIEGINSVSIYKHGAWNPLSQKLTVNQPDISNANLGASFVNLQYAIRILLLLSHEALHIAFWESFFSGQWKPETQEEFIHVSLLSEAAALFDTDFVQTPRIRKLVPFGEPILARTAISQETFHPEAAFENHGITLRSAILNYYLHAVSAPRFCSGTSFLERGLLEKLRRFHVRAPLHLGSYWELLSEIGIFGRFFDEFCTGGLPTFLSGRVRPDIEFFRRYRAQTLKPLASLKPLEIEHLRRRRSVQVRAFYALQVRYCIATGRISPRPNRKRLLSSVESYLRELRLLLRSLPTAAFGSRLCAADEEYERSVRSRFSERASYVNSRRFIFPEEPAPEISTLKTFSAREKERIWLVLNRRLVNGTPASASSDSWKTGRILSQIPRASAKRLNRILLEPSVADLWTVRAESISPRFNRFNDWLFVYE